MRMRKKPNLIPRMERCADYLVTDPQQWRGRWREKGTPGCELRLELGCGKGRFTCETAAAEPDVLFVAVERVPDAMVIAMERAKAAGITDGTRPRSFATRQEAAAMVLAAQKLKDK